MPSLMELESLTICPVVCSSSLITRTMHGAPAHAPAHPRAHTRAPVYARTRPRTAGSYTPCSTIYEIIKDATGKLLYAVPDYQFRWNDPAKGYTGPTTSCVPTTGSITTLDGGRPWNNTARAHSPGVTVPCIGGQQKWSGIYYTGLITQHPTGTEDYSIRGKFRVPINLHIGEYGSHVMLSIELMPAKKNKRRDSTPASQPAAVTSGGQ